MSACGVDIMNDDPKCVKYLYAKIKSDALQQIGDGILKRFLDSGKFCCDFFFQLNYLAV